MLAICSFVCCTTGYMENKLPVYRSLFPDNRNFCSRLSFLFTLINFVEAFVNIWITFIQLLYLDWCLKNFLTKYINYFLLPISGMPFCKNRGLSLELFLQYLFMKCLVSLISLDLVYFNKIFTFRALFTKSRALFFIN